MLTKVNIVTHYLKFIHTFFMILYLNKDEYFVKLKKR